MKSLLIACVVSLATLSSQAALFGFDMANPPPPDTYLESIAGQMFMDTDTSGSILGLSNIGFTNAGPSDSVITEIYFGSFDESINLDVTDINGCSEGVNFQLTKLKPSDPPGANGDVTWWYITLDGADTVNPPPDNGISPYKCLNLEVSYDDSIYNMSFTEMIQNDIVQVALHVTGLSDPDSATFVNDTVVVPEPASLVLIGSAGVLIGFVRRRFVA